VRGVLRPAAAGAAAGGGGSGGGDPEGAGAVVTGGSGGASCSGATAFLCAGRRGALPMGAGWRVCTKLVACRVLPTARVRMVKVSGFKGHEASSETRSGSPHFFALCLCGWRDGATARGGATTARGIGDFSPFILFTGSVRALAHR
jgi:hypothetical protein